MVAAPVIATRWIDARAFPPATTSALLQITCAGAFLSLPRAMYAALFRGLQRMAVLNAIEVGWVALQQAGMIALLVAGGGLFNVAGWFAGAYALAIVAYLVVAGWLVSPIAALPGFSMSAVRRNAAFAGQMMSSSAFGAVLGQADRLLVSKLLPVRALGTYGFAAAVAATLGRVAYAIVLAAFPSFSEIYRRNGPAGMRQQHQRVQALVLVLAAPGFAALAFFARPVFSWVFGPADGGSLVWPVIILCAGWYLNAAISPSYFVSVAAGRADISARQNFLALFMVLPVGALLTWRLGLIGAAATWLAYHLFALAYGVPRICRECLEQRVTPWFKELARMSALVAATYLPAFVVISSVGQDAPAWLIPGYALATAGFVLGAARLHREELRALVRPASALAWKNRAA
jgi:O-antigen/teichoic acid export membrane protein